ncbi:MarR family transcriptional regulator [Ferrovibrio sp.]|uniref:MarR family winged helix-turn-helix transcriptional regulator n=1 Tax=Ferrovibrio sp. TaxID=1917215 RepID=UPI00262D0523|nr:MarR family transcriptional regulator [Ferrovibrio sp.]
MNDIDTDEATLILRGVLALARRMRTERPDDAMSPASVALLGALYRLGPVPAVQLAAELHLQPQSLTRLLDTLEHHDLIARKPGTHDRRERVITLTRRGRGAFMADMRDRRQWLKTAMAATLTGRERTVLAEAAQAMLKLAKHDAAGSGSETADSPTRRRALEAIA